MFEDTASEHDAHLSELTSIVCHELNNSLNGILLQVAVMEQTLTGKPRADLDAIRRLSRGAAELIKQLQQHNRLLQMVRKPVDVNAVVKTSAEAMRSHYPEADIQILPSREPCQALADAAVLSRILWLLGRHSFALASKDKPRIFIETITGKDRPKLLWRDHGPEVSEEELERIFEPFASIRPGADDTSLAVVRLLVRRLRGSIHATNHAEGGLEFTVDLSAN